MHGQQSGRVLGTLMLASVAAGCASAGQVRASEPHAQVEVRIEHGGARHDADYVDSLYLDGLHYGLVAGDPMLLRLAPGKHELQLVSQKTDLRVQLVTSSESQLQCRTPGCVDQAMVAPARDDRLELHPAPQEACVQTVLIEAKAGERLQKVLVASPDGTCATRG
jgi:hypothetical protein